MYAIFVLYGVLSKFGKLKERNEWLFVQNNLGNACLLIPWFTDSMLEIL